MHRPNKSNLVKTLDDDLKDLQPTSMIYLSMDWTTTNRAVGNTIQSHWQGKGRHTMVNLLLFHELLKLEPQNEQILKQTHFFLIPVKSYSQVC